MADVNSTVRSLPLASIRLAPPAKCGETIRVLEALLNEARSGQIVGIAFVAMYKKRSYTVDLSGEASRNPTFTRGMVKALDDRLSEMVRAR
ncbi:MAG: hypothetical protein Q7J47_05975 [Azoarcus sp.]|nr:hypothetical protein [Azoarcus sp.]